jgi:hypothetical protein
MPPFNPAQVRSYGSASSGKGGLNAMTEIAVGTGLGLVLGAVWKASHFGQKARMADYYVKK